MRTMAKDIIWQVGGSIVNRASFFVALLLLSGYMSATTYGSFGLIYNMALGIASIVSCGLGIVARRELSGGPWRGRQEEILSSNTVLILFFCLVGTVGATIYHLETGHMEVGRAAFAFLLFFLAVSASLSYYLNYHYSGLGLFKSYNQILLPINIFLPAVLLLLRPESVAVAVVLIAVTLTVGNVWQTVHLKGFRHGLHFSFQKEKHPQFYPCFLQALLGLPVNVVLQMVIVGRWNDISLIGAILVATQLLNMCNIFATKSLTVFSVSLTRALERHGFVPLRLFLRYFLSYMGLLLVVHLAIWLLLPFIVAVLKSSMTDAIGPLRYFVVLNVVISSSWFLVEYFHAIKQSWVALAANVASSAGIFLVFFLFYYRSPQFTLYDYANCLAAARLFPIVLCGYYILRTSRQHPSRL